MLNTDFRFGEVHSFAAHTVFNQDSVTFKRIFENKNGGVSLLTFKAGQKLDEHVAPAQVMVTVLKGRITFTMAGTPHTIAAGEFMLMGVGVPHSVQAEEDSEVLLVKVRD